LRRIYTDTHTETRGKTLQCSTVDIEKYIRAFFVHYFVKGAHQI